MKLLENILLPIDINTDFEEQLNVAIELAKSFNSEIIIIYVLPEQKLHIDIKELVINAVSDSMLKVKETITNMGVVVRETVIEYGDPVEKTLQMAVKEDVNLILLGSGDKGKNEKFQLGITAEKLIRLSDKPVWVVKSNEKNNLNNILCPVDFSDASKRALKNAVLLSRKFKGNLRILGVYEPYTNTSPKLKINEEMENAILLKKFEEKMSLFVKDFDLNGVNFKIDMQAGVAHERILQTIKEYGHNLLVIGTNGRSRSGLSRFLLGSITEKVTREMPCSFVTTKTQNIIQLKIDSEIKEIEIHFKNAHELVESGFYKEAIKQYMICLQINDMHIPSIYKLAELHKKEGDISKAQYYDDLAKELLARIWDRNIEEEIRRYYKSGK